MDKKFHCTMRHRCFSFNDGSGGDIWSLAFLNGTSIDPCSEFLRALPNMPSTQILSLSAKRWQTHKNWYREGCLSSWARLAVILGSATSPSPVACFLSLVLPQSAKWSQRPPIFTAYIFFPLSSVNFGSWLLSFPVLSRVCLLGISLVNRVAYAWPE